MADRPLRPATRRCLGEPLPHQLADRPRDPPKAPEHFLTWTCDLVGTSGISPSFLGLSRSSGQVSHVLLTRSPLDLHQYCYRMDLARLACVRHAASVRPEPGSNSPSRTLADCPEGLPVDDQSKEPTRRGLGRPPWSTGLVWVPFRRPKPTERRLFWVSPRQW